MSRFALTLCAWGTERLELEQAFRFQFHRFPLSSGNASSISNGSFGNLPRNSNAASHTLITVRARLGAMTACELVMPPQDLRWLRGYVLCSVLERMPEDQIEDHHSHLEWRLNDLHTRNVPVTLGETFVLNEHGFVTGQVDRVGHTRPPHTASGGNVATVRRQ